MYRGGGQGVQVWCQVVSFLAVVVWWWVVVTCLMIVVGLVACSLIET